jgi:hypothetical protein
MAIAAAELNISSVKKDQEAEFSKVAERWQREMPYYQKKDGDEGWNSEVAQSIDSRSGSVLRQDE